MTRADRLRTQRERRGLKQVDLAVQAGISVATLSNFEQDRFVNRTMNRGNAIAVLRTLYEAEPLTADEIEAFRDDFGLAARDVDQAIGDLQRAAAATTETEWADRIRADIARIAAHVGAEAAAEHIANLAALVSLASAQTELDEQVNIATRLTQFSVRNKLAATESAGRRTITVRQPPEPGEASGLPTGSTIERFEHYTVDEATSELRRLLALRDDGKPIDAEHFVEAMRSIANRTRADADLPDATGTE
ncbi:MAG: helix-turn-helix transcriptional regulator [Planctomycetota bacterium]